MKRAAIMLMLGVSACAASETVQEAIPSVDGWKFASGKAPTVAEYSAVVASCQAGVVRAAGKPLETCLADLGLRRGE